MFLMVIAGNETTTKLLANAAFWGHKNPDQLTPVYADLSRVPLWVEETLRYDTSSQILARTVSGELTLYDTTIPEGDVLLLLPGSAHRDERVFDNPDDYLIGREIGPKLLSFGSGAHFCLGAHLARMEARVALTELFKRIRGYEVDEANAVRVHSSNVRGFAHLPITVEVSLNAPLRTPSGPPARDRRRRIVGHRRGHRRRACRAWLSGGAGRPPRREVRGDRREDPRRRRRGDRASARRHRPESVKGFVHQATEQLGDIEVLVAGAGDTYFGELHEIDTGSLRIADPDPPDRGQPADQPRCCRAWSSVSAAT